MKWPRIRVLVGFTVTPDALGDYFHLSDPARGRLGSGRLAPQNVTIDVSPYLWGDGVAIHIKRGAEPPGDRFLPGSCTVTFKNRDGRYDPLNLAGPYVAGGATQVEPGRRLQIIADLDGVGYPLFTGLIRSWEPDVTNHKFPLMHAHALDYLEVSGRVDNLVQNAQGGGEDTGARLHRILDAAEFPAADRVIDAGDSTLQATTLAQNARTEAWLSADSEFGYLWIDGAGRVVFKRRRSILQDQVSKEVQFTFGTGPDELRFVRPFPAYDIEQLENVVVAARAGGVEQVAQDTVSKQKYLSASGPSSRSDLLVETDKAARYWGRWKLHLRKDVEYRFEQIVLDPTLSDDAWGVVLAADFHHRVKVNDRMRYVDPDTGPFTVEVAKDCFVKNIEHTIGPKHAWSCVLGLGSAEKLVGRFRLGHETLGRLGSGRLAPL